MLFSRTKLCLRFGFAAGRMIRLADSPLCSLLTRSLPEGLGEGEGQNVTVDMARCGAAERWQVEAGRAELTDGQVAPCYTKQTTG